MGYLEIFIKLITITAIAVVAFLCSQFLVSPATSYHFPTYQAENKASLENFPPGNVTNPAEKFSSNVTNPAETLNKILKLFSSQYAKIEECRTTFLQEIHSNLTKQFLEPKLQNKQYSGAIPGVGYFPKLDKYKGIRTINFTTSLKDISSIWPYKFHQQGITKNVGYRKGKLPPQFGPSLSQENSIQNVNPAFVGVLQTTQIPAEHGGDVLLTFLHIIKNAVVFMEGIVAHSDVHINPKACKYEQYRKTNSSNSLPKFDEVFTIAQFWGEGFFHSTIENIPRLATYVDFLRKHQSIKIHCKTKASFTVKLIRQLGLNNDIVTGHVKANIVYMPAGVGCGSATTFPSAILNLYLRTFIELPSVERKSVVVIKRSTRRWFGDHNGIWNMLQKHQKKYGYNLELFSDRHMPKFKDSMKLFNRAIMVIGPHGAGLSNIFYSQPETVVIEGLCHDINLCYSRLAFVLGDIYYGIVPNHDCRDTTPEMVEKAVLPYLDWFKATKQL